MRIASYALLILIAASQTGCGEPPGPPPTPLAPAEPATKEQQSADDSAPVHVPEQSTQSPVALSPADEKPVPKTEQEAKPPNVEPVRKGDPEPEKARSAKEIVSKTLPGVKLMRIPAGEFTMGSPKEEKNRSEDETQHEVTLTKDYYMGETHITVGQWRAFQKATGHDAKAGVKLSFAQEDHPVVNVNWEDAKTFCAWLSKEDGRKYRLPTEAEWEYACRAGTKTAYWYGEEADATKANFSGSQVSGTTGVKKYEANGYGLYDMNGNAFQWCEDWYGQYQNDKQTNPVGISKGSDRVVRGGSWFNFARLCRSAYWDRYVPADRDDYVGFRLASGPVDENPPPRSGPDPKRPAVAKIDPKPEKEVKPAPIDPKAELAAEKMLSDILGEPSDTYTERGYLGHTFGDSREAVEKKSEIVQKISPEFFQLKDGKGVMFGPDGRLIAVSSSQSIDDNERLMARTKDRFGGATEANIERMEFTDQRNRKDILRATWHFPNVIVRAQFEYINNGGSKSEFGNVVAIDRKWAIEEVSKVVGQRREALAWFRKLADAAGTVDVDIKNLPSMERANLEEERGAGVSKYFANGRFWTSKTAAPSKANNAKRGDQDKSFLDAHSEWFSLVSPADCFGVKPPKGSVLTAIRLDKWPDSKQSILARTHFHYLLGRIDSVLVQEAFPPRTEKIAVNRFGGAVSYEWMTKEYYAIQVAADHTVIVVRRPDE